MDDAWPIKVRYRYLLAGGFRCEYIRKRGLSGMGTVCLGAMAGGCYVFDTPSYGFATDIRLIFASNNTDYGFKNREAQIMPGLFQGDAGSLHAY